MKNFIALSFCLWAIKISFAQTAADFFYTADSFYSAKDYKNSALAYSAGIREKGNNAILFRFSSCASTWSLAGVPDSAFYYLDLLSISGKVSAPDVNAIINDNTFNLLRTDKRWKPLIEKISKEAAKNSFAQEEIIYGRKDGMGLTMVWIKPKIKANEKAIVFVQSGAWISGNNGTEIQTELLQVYLKKGFSVFVVMHGSQPRYAIPDAVEDIKRAIRYIRYNVRKFAINPNKIGITGNSSGGHLSLVIAMAEEKIDSNSADPVNKVSSRVQAAAVLYPPTDFLNWGKPGLDILHDRIMSTVRLNEAFNFKTIDRRSRSFNIVSDSASKYKIVKEISPIYSISPDDPPIFIIHGDSDPLVPLQQSETFILKLKEAGVTNKFIIKKGAGHAFEDMLPELNQFANWFDMVLK